MKKSGKIIEDGLKESQDAENTRQQRPATGYTVKFREDALKEWKNLDPTIQRQFAKKLLKCCENPHIPSAKLRGIKDCYKIKLRASGFRLVYEVIDNTLIIVVVAVGKREHSDVYSLAIKRTK